MQNLLHPQPADTAPIVTFIVTYYNQPVPMLCKCIDSILGLSLSNDEREVIIIDDGAEVSPMNGLMHYGDNIVYVRQKNQGLSMARNKGIEMAKGRYLQFVDADDYLIKQAYEHCLDIVKSDPTLDMVLFDFTHRPTSQTTFTDQPVQSGTAYMRWQNIHATACGYLFRRTTVSELRFTPGIWHEDEEFTPLLLIRADRICVTNAKAYFYYKHPGTITTSTENEKKRFSDLMGVLSRLQNQLDRIPQNERQALQRRIAQLTMDCIYKVIVSNPSRQRLNTCIEDLRQKGLFPLPDRDYTPKYTMFRHLANSALGRTILLHTLPLLKKER